MSVKSGAAAVSRNCDLRVILYSESFKIARASSVDGSRKKSRRAVAGDNFFYNDKGYIGFIQSPSNILFSNDRMQLVRIIELNM